MSKPRGIVVITGTSSGIGLACAKKFLSERFIVHGIDKEARPGDLMEYSDYYHYIQDIRNKYRLPPIPGVEYLINNAGVQDSDDDIGVNLKGTINVTEAYGIQPCIKGIVTVASTSAHNGAEFPEYAASKGGLLTYSKNVAKRVAMYGATSNTISPGGVLNSLNDVVINDPVLWEAVMNDTPLRKWATCEEIADWIYFIAVVNKSMTGQDVLVDNGEQVNQTFYWI